MSRQVLFSLLAAGSLSLFAGAAPAQEDLLAAGVRALQSGDSSAATEAFQAVIESNPDDAAAWLGLSAAAELAGNWPEALRAARQAAGLAPDQAAAQVALGRMLGLAGRVDEALAAFARARELMPDQEEAYLLAAVLLRDGGRSDEALALLEEGRTKVEAPSPRLGEQLAFLALAAGDAAKALEAADEALSGESATGDLLLAKALALAVTSARRAEAPGWFERALSAGVTREGRARLEWGRLLAELGEWPAAVGQLELASGLLPSEAEVFFRLGAARRQAGDADGAAEAMSRYQELNEASVAAERHVREVGTALNEAQEMANGNRLDEALARLDDVDATSDPRVLLLRAKVLFSLGRLEEALAAAVAAAQMAPFEVEPAYLTAMFAFAANDPKVALAAVERTLTLEPRLAQAWALRGSALARSQRLEEAVHSFEQALKLGFDSPQMRLDYAGVLSDLGRPDESREQLEAREKLTGG